MGASAALLGAEGPLSQRLTAFAPRAAQIELAEAIEDTLADGGVLVAEAGTGIGKTLAYLVPVIESGSRAILSTGTKTLQDQLFFRDLPLVAEALGKRPKAALLKGRANYLCLHRMELTRERGEFPSREAPAQLQRVVDWSSRTRDGDLSVADVLPEDSALWPLVTSTNENCLGTKCPDYDDCHVARARRRAQEADIVVVNHHLLFADMALKQKGFGEVLPGAELFVVDEAHQAPELASRFFGVSLTARQVDDLCKDILAEAGEVPGALGAVRTEVAACKDALAVLRASLAERLPDRGPWHRLLEHAEIREALQGLDQAVADLAAPLAGLEGVSRGLDGCADRRDEMQAKFDRLDSAGAGEVRWFERRGRGFGLHITPLDVSEAFTGYRDELDAAWVFTSATLAVNGDFRHFTREMGLDDATTLALGSPFDYPNNALLWTPALRVQPNHPGYTEAVLETVEPALQASQGRAFLLFTSHRALQAAAHWLAQRVDFPLFVQGTAPRSSLLKSFRESGNGVLLGTASFWEGVDVMGEALSLVVIDKLPFAAPDDPVMEAQSARLRDEGGNPFMDLAVPRAVIALKQGAGRLIRDVADRGVLVVCDPRLTTKGYGAAFLHSLPPMRRTDTVDEVIDFFATPGVAAAAS
ncbi:ATP-dependent DNA helicase [Marinihelvus fidelis]|uniref:ATP-dependent DNA helicase n=1 Tax=Marinihelvus fidelis TaxID=2613842 RepID=A0A5N0TEH4_9GAMM|nr:ATP-dependent DNA helicase [Marinihelvus fidelis]KAA9133432.1 ATP-dependent DNA helicase [Marinihelvus fidelis]